jgi:predicted dehydrogenase
MSKPLTIRVGMIGCGAHAREVLLPALRSVPGVIVATLCDNDDDRLDQARSFCPSAWQTKSFEAVCGDRSIDAIVVAATPQVHAAAARAALRRAKHVFVEKPMAVSGAAAEELAALADEAGVVTMVGHNFRFAPAVERMKTIMADKEFGSPALVEIRYFASKPRGSRWGIQSPERSFLLSHGSHAFDIALDLFGDGVVLDDASVRSRNGRQFAAVRLKGPHGCICSVALTNGAPHFDLGVTVVSDRNFVIDMRSLREVRSFGDPDNFKRIGSVWVPSTLPAGFVDAGYAGELSHFFHAIRERTPATPSFRDAQRVSALIDSVLECANR